MIIPTTTTPARTPPIIAAVDPMVILAGEREERQGVSRGFSTLSLIAVLATVSLLQLQVGLLMTLPYWRTNASMYALYLFHT